MNVKTYRYGIIGPGRIATSYCKALQRCERVTIHAVASRDEQRAREFAQQFGAVKAYNNYKALVEDPEVDVVYIATPHSFHAEQVLLCLRHHKPVVCEKPLTLDAATVSLLVKASQENKTFLMEGMWSRFNPTVRKAKELIDAGVVGEVKHLTADFGFQKPYDPNTRLYDMSLGGGSILDVGVYPLFLALFLFGRPHHIDTSASLAPTGADESCAFTLRYNSGTIAQLFSSMVVETRKDAIINGTKGAIVIHTPWYKSMGLTVLRTGVPEEKVNLPYPGNGFEFQVDEVTRCLDRGWIESDLMSHEFMIMKAEVSDEILRQSGVVYPKRTLQ